jgi:hypothetical protein
VTSVIASGNRAQLEQLRSLSLIALEETRSAIANATIPAQIEALNRQARALEEAQRMSEQALVASAQQTQIYVGAALAGVVILAGTYVYVQEQQQQGQRQGQTQRKAA